MIWTLRHEAIFYSVFALTFIAFPRAKLFLVGWFLLPIFFSFFLHLSTDISILDQVIRLITHPVNVEFGTGFVLGVLYLRRTKLREFAMPVHPALILTGLFSLLFICAYWFDLSVNYVEKTLIAAAICAPIVWLATLMRCPRSSIGKLFGLMGDASYSIICSTLTWSRRYWAYGHVSIIPLQSGWLFSACFSWRLLGAC